MVVTIVSQIVVVGLLNHLPHHHFRSLMMKVQKTLPSEALVQEVLPQEALQAVVAQEAHLPFPLHSLFPLLILVHGTDSVVVEDVQHQEIPVSSMRGVAPVVRQVDVQYFHHL